MTEKGSRQAGTRRGACPGGGPARRSNATTVAIIRNMKREEYTRGMKGGQR